MPRNPEQKLVPHVQAAVAKAVQPTKTGEVGGGRPLAPHVKAAIAAGQGVGQAKVAVGGVRQTAAHVQAAIAGAMQKKVPGVGVGRPVAAHARALPVQRMADVKSSLDKEYKTVGDLIARATREWSLENVRFLQQYTAMERGLKTPQQVREWVIKNGLNVRNNNELKEAKVDADIRRELDVARRDVTANVMDTMMRVEPLPPPVVRARRGAVGSRGG